MTDHVFFCLNTGCYRDKDVVQDGAGPAASFNFKVVGNKFRRLKEIGLATFEFRYM